MHYASNPIKSRITIVFLPSFFPTYHLPSRWRKRKKKKSVTLPIRGGMSWTLPHILQLQGYNVQYLKLKRHSLVWLVLYFFALSHAQPKRVLERPWNTHTHTHTSNPHLNSSKSQQRGIRPASSGRHWGSARSRRRQTWREGNCIRHSGTGGSQVILEFRCFLFSFSCPIYPIEGDLGRVSWWCMMFGSRMYHRGGQSWNWAAPLS